MFTVSQAWQVFHTPKDSCRTKVWWFHGETETTREGITADLEAFKELELVVLSIMIRYTNHLTRLWMP